MKKLTVFVALALLAVAGTGYAVTCAYDNVPGATLLIPYFKVGGTVDPSGMIGSDGPDTKVSFTNVSTPGIIAHVIVWNKYSQPVLDFNVPMTGKDVVFFSMRNVLNGLLNVNPSLQDPAKKDVCGLNLTNGVYNAVPYIGWGQKSYLRFAHPQSTLVPTPLDPQISVSIYQTPDAFKPVRPAVLGSLDEGSDISSFTSATGAGILDVDNYYCGLGSWPLISSIAGPFTGYITVDVVNYCTNYMADQAEFYELDAIATSGWYSDQFGGNFYGYTPNVLMGDVYFVDPTQNTGNISGDFAIPLEFDVRLNDTYAPDPAPTFYGRFVVMRTDVCEGFGGTSAPCGVNVPPNFTFGGDGREPLGDRYGFRYLNQTDSSGSMRTWMTVWRGDLTWSYTNGYGEVNLCQWLNDYWNEGEAKTWGLYDTNHQLVIFTYGNDEESYTNPTCPPGYPSPCPPGAPPLDIFAFLESGRYDLLNNSQVNPGLYVGGWMDAQFRASTFMPYSDAFYGSLFNQAWVGVEHTAPGTGSNILMSVGYGAANLSNDWTCTWWFGTTAFGSGGNQPGFNNTP